MKWERVEFNDVLEKIIGGGTPSKTVLDYWNGDIPWCSVKDMAGDKYQLYSTEDTISHAGLASSSSNLIPTGTVITSTRMGLGRVFINKVDMAINQDLKALIPNNKIDNTFLLWTIVNKKEEIEGLGVGSTVKGIRLEVLKGLKLYLPPLPTQRKIASILSAYDDLIENNLKRIKLLEEQTFVTYKGVVKTERLEKTSVFDYAEIMSGGTPSTTNPNFWDGEIPFFTPKDLSSQSGYYLIDTERKLTELGLEKCNSKLFPRNTIFITARGTVGKLVLSKIPSAISQSNYAITTRNGSSNYFLFLALIDKVNHFKQLAVGGVFDTIIVDTFKMIFIELPSENIINQFNIEIKPIFQLIDILQKQNTKLREARDILLPKLMNGQIEV